MRITLRQLDVFRAVFETRQLSRASKRLSMSVSAVSQSLRSLEDGLGVELFDRNTASAKPTEAAQTLYPRAVLLIKKAQEIEEIFEQHRSGLAGTLTLGANRNYGIYVLSRRLPAFKLKRPSIETVLRIEDDDAIIAGVASNAIDVGFVSKVPTDAHIESFPCFLERMCIVASATSNIANINLRLEDLSAVTWILPQEADVRQATQQWLRERGAFVTQSIQMNQMGAIKRAVGTGLGVAYLSYLSVCEEIKRGELIELFADQTQGSGNSQVIYAIFKPERVTQLRQTFFNDCAIEPISPAA